jgi:hypothetical protein
MKLKKKLKKKKKNQASPSGLYKPELISQTHNLLNYRHELNYIAKHMPN